MIKAWQVAENPSSLALHRCVEVQKPIEVGRAGRHILQILAFRKLRQED